MSVSELSTEGTAVLQPPDAMSSSPNEPQRFGGYELRLMSSVNDGNGIPAEGNRLIVVAVVERGLHFRIFDDDGKMIVDTDAKSHHMERARAFDDLRKQLESLWPPHELTGSEKVRIIVGVTSIIGPTRVIDPIVLSTRNLSVWYGSSLALRDITIEIPRNKITALIGPSGCGKSTLLRCFNRMNDLIIGTRMNGEIRFDGDLISGGDRDVVVLRRRIGMVFQKPNPFPKTIYNNVAWGARINGYRGDMDELVQRSLQRAALWDEVKTKLNRSGLELSGGQQQRLCIARTLAVEPEVILMDEPCSALDPTATKRVDDLMDDLKNDYTIVIVTHNMAQARRVSDMTALLMTEDVPGESQRAGILEEFSPTDRLFTNPKSKRTEDYITGRIG